MMKFVPASGAASRMFKLLLSFLHRCQRLDMQEITGKARHGDQECQELWRWFAGLKQFAFYDDLKTAMAKHSLDLDIQAAQSQCADILAYLLTPKGLNYANLPKGLLQFHRYPDHCRTPFEEHLVEAAAYTQDQQGIARLHFTVTPEHQAAFITHMAAIRRRYEHDGVRFEVTFSTQHPATDTIAVDVHNAPCRDQHGQLLFRPAGHGALLENLQALQGDIIFIKNIDNVVPDHLKAETYLYKKALGGYLVEVQNQVFAYLRELSAPPVSDTRLRQILPWPAHLSIVRRLSWSTRQRLKNCLSAGRTNRPIRLRHGTECRRTRRRSLLVQYWMAPSLYKSSRCRKWTGAIWRSGNRRRRAF
jgi:hypothetical protein